MSDAVVLDTSAIFAFSQVEPGEEIVGQYLEDAVEGRVELHGSFVTLTELEYMTTQRHGEARAQYLLRDVKSWPVRWHHSDDAVCSAAAKLKAAHKLSFADSFVVALAQRLDATLVHKDPEMDALGAAVKQRMLPPKTGTVE